MKTPTILTPLKLGARRLQNRLVALPVFTGYARPDGRVSSLLLGHYSRLAATGVSMVVVANVAVAPEGVTSTYNLRIDDDRFMPGLAELATAIRGQGTLAAIQLNHAGRFARSDHPLLASPADTSHMLHHVSALKGFMHAFPFEQRFGLTRFFLRQISRWHRSMTQAEMDAVVAQFARAAGRACEAGFDVIELHGANGYLLCEFLSPATNKRLPDVGGGLDGRTAFPLAVVRAVMERLPPAVPLGFRLALDEYTPEGIGPTEAAAVGRRLEEAGVAYLSAAAGTFSSMFRPGVLEKMARLAYLREETKRLTEGVTIPTIASGRITTPDLANELLGQGVAHLIGLGRPLRVDPDWVKKARRQTGSIVRCINCNGCIKGVVLEQGFVCRCWPKTKQLKTHLDHMLLSRNDRCLWAIADAKDAALFKTVIPDLLPFGRRLETNPWPTLLFLNDSTLPGEASQERQTIVEWIKRQAHASGHPPPPVCVVNRQAHHGREIEIDAELERRDLGMVLIGSHPGEAWRERLFFRLRHKVIGQIAANPNVRRIAVCLDFSDASLLALSFARRTFMHRRNLTVDVIHVATGGDQTATRQWPRLQRVVGLEPETPLTIVPPTGAVAEDLIGELEKGRYGTVIMGKRGLSNIKRLLVGSVSRSVLRAIGERTVFLVD
jgi:2,4-dienoyl-CoA reductase-like NADH-dependent reductase (Old Yellow Enzyme family)